MSSKYLLPNAVCLQNFESANMLQCVLYQWYLSFISCNKDQHQCFDNSWSVEVACWSDWPTHPHTAWLPYLQQRTDLPGNQSCFCNREEIFLSVHRQSHLCLLLFSFTWYLHHPLKFRDSQVVSCQWWFYHQPTRKGSSSHWTFTQCWGIFSTFGRTIGVVFMVPSKVINSDWHWENLRDCYVPKMYFNFAEYRGKDVTSKRRELESPYCSQTSAVAKAATLPFYKGMSTEQLPTVLWKLST